MADWNPALFTRCEDERTRAACDLLARGSLQSASALSAPLRERFPRLFLMARRAG
jgi:hypothetical protein